MKNRWIAAIGMAVLTVGGMAWAGGAGGPGPTIPKLGPAPTIPGIRPTIPLPECRDPKAMGLKFAVISKDPKWPATQGKIRITGAVKNVGNAVFESDPRQASAQLLEERPGARAEMKAQQNIARLNPGQSINLNYERAWNTATEFPPKYILMIVYDPDIYIDANKKNDDCNRNNNRAELTGQTINSAWPK
ncbi:MAG: hypothetical protein HY574_09110 [candidate division NC10 bacterium]|nr:hypothetical protein [candidate division NC10 bacterium]